MLGVALMTVDRSDTREIDGERSAITIQVDKTGWFSSFGDRHVVQAPIAHGWINGSSRPAVEFQVDSKRLTVLDPNASIDTRREVQHRMLGPDVLDADRYPAIAFRSTTITAVDDNRWTVTGDLTLHGVTRSIAGAVSWQAGRYVGSATVTQRDFGIEPIAVAGGLVKVKDEVRITFVVVPR
jgi:polyisoprenoid-binding protein YceI